MQPSPIGREIDAAFRFGRGRRHQPVGQPSLATLHQFHALIRQQKIDCGGQRSSIQTFQPIPRAAVLGWMMRHHPKAVGNRLVGLRFLLHARVATPPRMDIRPMDGIDKADDSVIRRTRIRQRNMKGLLRFRWKRHPRNRRQRDRATFVRKIEPDHAIGLFRWIGCDPNFIRL